MDKPLIYSLIHEYGSCAYMAEDEILEYVFSTLVFAGGEISPILLHTHVKQFVATEKVQLCWVKIVVVVRVIWVVRNMLS